MEITRRDFGRLAGAAWVSGAASAAGAAEAGGGEWRAGNDGIAQVLRLEHGRFYCASLRDLGAGREWIHPALPSLEFRIDLTAGGREAQLTGAGPFRGARAETSLAGGWRALKLELTSAELPFTVIREYFAHARLPLLRTRTSVRNEGTTAATLRRIDSFSLRVAPAPEPLDLHWIDNFCRAMLPVPGNPLHRCAMTENVRQVLRTGPYSPQFGWFSLMLAGESLVGGWEWSGPMAVAFGDLVDPCPIEGGLDPEGMHEELAPGATFHAPVAWYGFSRGLEEQAALSHELVRTALGPPLPEREFPWIAYCTWASSLDTESPHNEPGTDPWFPTERNLLSQVEAAAAIGCELYLWDHGWFARRGDWWCDPQRFPNGPRTVVRAVKQRGMKLGLWIGFGNADETSAVVRQHPEWLAVYGGRPIPDRFFTRTAAEVWHTRTLCLAHRPVREWVKDQLARVIETFELDWLKHDFDIVTICDSGEHTHTRGDSRIAACEAFYEVMDFVRQKYPALVCENWVNNSGVPDYGALQRHHVQLIGDTYAASVLRQMFQGHLLVFPPDRQQRYIRFENSAGDLKAMLRSGFLGGPCTLLSDPRLLTPDQRAILAGEIERYKRWRSLFGTGRVYSLLGRAHPRSWDATEFYDGAAGRGLVFVFRNDTAEAARTLLLRGLDAGARYRLEIVDQAESRIASGRELLEPGLAVRIPERNRSEMILLTRMDS